MAAVHCRKECKSAGSSHRRKLQSCQPTARATGALLAAVTGIYYTSRHAAGPRQPEDGEPTEQTLLNWSGTHQCNVKRLWQPESQAELERLVKNAHNAGAVGPPSGRADPISNPASPQLHVLRRAQVKSCGVWGPACLPMASLFARMAWSASHSWTRSPASTRSGGG